MLVTWVRIRRLLWSWVHVWRVLCGDPGTGKSPLNLELSTLLTNSWKLLTRRNWVAWPEKVIIGLQGLAAVPLVAGSYAAECDVSPVEDDELSHDAV